MMCYDKIYLPLLTEPDLTDKMENDMKEVDPKSTSRALAFELWMKAPKLTPSSVSCSVSG